MRRTWHVHVPKGYEHGRPVPLVMAIHGWQRSGKYYENASGLTEVSDALERGFVVVYPDGFADNAGASDDGWHSWNVVGTTQSPGPDGPICAPKADHPEYCYESCQCEERPQCSWTTCANDITPRGVGTSEVTGFLPRLLDQLLDEYCVDVDRLYVTGESNGGMATYQMGVSLSHRLAAIAPTCGSFARGFAQVPAVPLPVMDVHGFSDTEVPANATGGGPWAESADGYYYVPVPRILEGWRRANRCDGEESVTLSRWRTRLDGEHDLYCVQEGRGCAAPVVRCGYAGAHGAFPNGPGLNGGVLNGRLVWEFLSQFRRPRLEGEEKKEEKKEEAPAEEEPKAVAKPKKSKKVVSAEDLALEAELEAQFGDEGGLTRKQREELEQQREEKEAQKAMANGESDQAKADMARLQEIRQKREEQAKKKAQDALEAEAKAKVVAEKEDAFAKQRVVAEAIAKLVKASKDGTLMLNQLNQDAGCKKVLKPLCKKEGVKALNKAWLEKFPDVLVLQDGEKDLIIKAKG